MKTIVIGLAAVALLSGCSTDSRNTGASDVETDRKPGTEGTAGSSSMIGTGSSSGGSLGSGGGASGTIGTGTTAGDRATDP